ncbi:rubredoxin [Blastochloris viridis]|uniref:Rubredoxin n=1 Tax=Blastochloris viridis TaxID=1079 RepID=A0A0H5BHB0_BLAVI|nr:rubredoxin [Blastochloris viridis]ALK09592.1 Rubredoxin [Blastochloris viridis]BAS00520.1 rubredoxin [Blastochloris viridis]CUU42255.1 Rubredoxin [Blastochloris viridis]
MIRPPPTPCRRDLLSRAVALGAAALAGWLGLGGASAATQRWVCTNPDCHPYIYDPAVGDGVNLADPDHPLPPGIAFDDLPDDWRCPDCGSPKSFFRPTRL